jgi:hypothetical protein
METKKIKKAISNNIFDLIFFGFSVKGEAIPLQTWAGPEVSRRLTLPDFKKIGT